MRLENVTKCYRVPSIQCNVIFYCNSYFIQSNHHPSNVDVSEQVLVFR